MNHNLSILRRRNPNTKLEQVKEVMVDYLRDNCIGRIQDHITLNSVPPSIRLLNGASVERFVKVTFIEMPRSSLARATMTFHLDSRRVLNMAWRRSFKVNSTLLQ